MKIKKISAIVMAVIVLALISIYVVPSVYSKVTSDTKIYKALSDTSDVKTYMCPMHPEITSDKPGTCPKCGMVLVLKKEEKESGKTYTCPMHPDITSDKPGDCPKCGMALVLKTDENMDKSMNCMDKEKCKQMGCDMDKCKGETGGCTSECMEKCKDMKDHKDMKMKEGKCPMMKDKSDMKMDGGDCKSKCEHK